jgi:hypothetical protein
MIEFLVFCLILVVGVGLLVVLPLMVLGAALKLLVGLLLLPFRILGALFAVIGAVLAGLFKGLFAVFMVLAGILVVPLLIVALPIGLLLLCGLVVAGVIKLFTGAAVAAA